MEYIKARNTKRDTLGGDLGEGDASSQRSWAEQGGQPRAGRCRGAGWGRGFGWLCAPSAVTLRRLCLSGTVLNVIWVVL